MMHIKLLSGRGDKSVLLKDPCYLILLNKNKYLFFNFSLDVGLVRV